MSKTPLTPVIIPMIRKIVPKMIAKDLLSVQPMSSAMGHIFSMSSAGMGIWSGFDIVENETLDTGEVWYTVRVSTEIREWLVDSFTNGPDYVIIDKDNYINCVDIPERILILLKLKWSE